MTGPRFLGHLPANAVASVFRHRGLAVFGQNQGTGGLDVVPFLSKEGVSGLLLTLNPAVLGDFSRNKCGGKMMSLVDL